jgi:RHS repeat-associated protein
VARDTTPPTLTLAALVQGEVHVTWSATDPDSGVDASTCLLEVREDEGAWQTFSTQCGGDDTHDGQPGHTYTLRLSASDNVSNAASLEVQAVFPYVKKYYYANGQRVAMRQEGVVYYIHSDHLGSTSLTTDQSQQVEARQVYYPYGTPRWSQGTLPTDYTFTGQRDEAGLGLMHYGARFYSPRLGRFVSADSIVPQPGNPQALNRYSYVLGNPVLYRDPSGHCIPGVNCPGDLPEPDWRPSADPRSMSQEEHIEYLLWLGVHFEREEAETGGTVGLSLSRDNLNFELGAALAKYMAQGGEASWQAAIGDDPFIVYAVAQFGSQLGEDAVLALGQAYQNRAAQQSALVNYPSLEIDSQRMPEIADGINGCSK